MLRRALVVAQVAFSVVLVGLAGLFGHNLFALRSVDLGFRNLNAVATLTRELALEQARFEAALARRSA